VLYAYNLVLSVRTKRSNKYLISFCSRRTEPLSTQLDVGWTSYFQPECDYDITIVRNHVPSGQ